MRKRILPLIVFMPAMILLGIDEPTVIKGFVAAPDMFPEAIYIENGEHARCTATIIGTQTILTAAHCVAKDKNIEPVDVDKYHFEATCLRHPLYRGKDHDIALCYSDVELHIKPARLAARGPSLGQKILISGYGCTTTKKTGGNDGIFRIGYSIVREIPAFDNNFVTVSESTICSGDSGGAAYLNEGNFFTDEHIVLGVNSRSNFTDRAVLEAIYTFTARTFFENWISYFCTDIAGFEEVDYTPIRPETPWPNIDEI